MTLPFNLNSILQNISKIKLHGGVVGKVVLGTIFICGFIAAISIVAKDLWISGAALALISIFSFTMFWRLINFADRHPEAALLEGSEFLVHETITQATKEEATVKIEPTDREQPIAVDKTTITPQIASQPDVIDIDSKQSENPKGVK